MILLSFVALCLAIATLQFNRRAADDVTHLLLNVTAFLSALFCILVAPWYVQLLMLLSLLVLPTCTRDRRPFTSPAPPFASTVGIAKMLAQPISLPLLTSRRTLNHDTHTHPHRCRPPTTFSRHPPHR
ncbi:MAG: hypothetical protein HC910_19150 [Spirulinaceae cyanobacterium SM2_1_0]|nr:hypothetical protein [Spirulinaceae cyanobacterium SM2_1_0]